MLLFDNFGNNFSEKQQEVLVRVHRQRNHYSRAIAMDNAEQIAMNGERVTVLQEAIEIFAEVFFSDKLRKWIECGKLATENSELVCNIEE